MINLLDNSQQKLALPDPPLAVMFGADNQALVVTTTQFLLYNPVSNTANLLDTVADFTANTTPRATELSRSTSLPPRFPIPGDGNTIYGVGGSGRAYHLPLRCAVADGKPGGIVLSNGNLGPRVVSLNQDRSKAMVGWIMLDRTLGITNFVPQASNQFSVGTTLFDDSRGLIYAQIPAVGEASGLADPGRGQSHGARPLAAAGKYHRQERLQLRLKRHVFGLGLGRSGSAHGLFEFLSAGHRFGA